KTRSHRRCEKTVPPEPCAQACHGGPAPMRQHPAPVRAFELVITKLHGGGSTRRITANSPDTEDDDVDVTCVSFAPGHNVHPIQANRGLRTPSDAYTIVAV